MIVNMLKLIMVLSFTSVLLLVFPIFRSILVRQNPIARIGRYIDSEAIREEIRKSSGREYKPGMNVLAKGIKNARFLDSYKRKVQVQLTRAHILLKPEEYIAICIIIFIAIGSLVTVFTGNFLFTITASVIGWIFPSIILKNKIKKRIKALNDQLSDAINLISNSLKAGFSFFQAVDVVSKEMQGPIAQEFAIMQKEVNLGLTTEKALENLVARTSSEDLELVVTAVLIQRQVGGNLSEILDNICSTIRERVKIKGEVRTLTAQGRMSGIIISVMPPALGVIIFLVNPEHIGLLFNNPIGIGILVFSVLMELIGIFAINKIVKIEF
jgi:tight adherence protein B